jgi:creatinine amidohydrolase
MHSDDGAGLLLEHMTWYEAQAARDEHRVLLIPIGAIEQHGPHLPLATDAIVAFELARRVARRQGAVVAPAMCYAARSSPRSGGGGRSFAGSTGVSGQTLISLVRDVTGEFFRTGFRRIAYLNAHYENSSLVYEALTEAIEPRLGTCKAIMMNWWEQIQLDDISQIFGDSFPGWEAEHAGVTETSLMEELRPDLVRTELKGVGDLARLVTYDIFPPPADVIPPDGVPWRSDLASPEIGRYLAGVLTDRIAAILTREFPRRQRADRPAPPPSTRPNPAGQPTHRPASRSTAPGSAGALHGS